LLALVKIPGSLELSGFFGPALVEAWPSAAPTLVMIVVGLFIIALAENSRIPFDDPSTHLELTMIHEVMVLDHSGPALGAIQYGAALKLFAFSALVVRLAVPVATGQLWVDWPVFIAGVLSVAVVIGVVESTMARLRLTHGP